jgi:GrpB-like predicted nucleotidyltransferase (UPF0157 family)
MSPSTPASRSGESITAQQAAGLEPVIVVPYDPRWPDEFVRLGAALRGALGDVVLRIDHIGSTAVPGLAAKPILDVQISVAAFEPLDAFRLPLERLGLVFRAANPDRTKRYFRLHDAAGARLAHVHVRIAGSWAEQKDLLFRDYMRAHPADAQRYGALKQRLAQAYGSDRVGYTDAKSAFVWEIMGRAHEWSMAVGWAPGPSDA